MKTLFAIFMSFAVSGSLTLSAQPAMRLAHTEYDFGRVPSRGGEVSRSFSFVNGGDAPLLLLSVETSCGCTTASFPLRPVAPGDSAAVVVKYDPRRESGRFYKAVQIFSNDPRGKMVVVVRGDVVKGKK